MDMLRRQSEPRRQEQPPDVAHAPLERYSQRGSRSLHAAAAADLPLPATVPMGVEQQFSGDGVPALTQTERSNRRARRTVSVLAALVLLLVVVPAILLITPNAFRAGYGVAPHTAIATVISTAIPPVADTPTPTPTAGPNPAGATTPAPHPTTTPHAVPTAMPRPKPTATPIPPTPTATPVPYGANATVTFKTAAQPVTLPPQVQVGDGGPVNATYAHDSEEALGNSYPATWHAGSPATAAVFTLEVFCIAGGGDICHGSASSVFPVSGGRGYCEFQNGVAPQLNAGDQGQVTCSMSNTGYQCPTFAGATFSYNISTPNGSIEVGEGQVINPIQSYCGSNATGASYTIPSQMQGCWIGWTNVGTNEVAWLRSQSAPYVLNGPNVAKTLEYCSDSNCNQVFSRNPSGPTYTSCARATGNELSYNPSDVINYQQSQLQQKVPPGWVADRQSVCASVNVGPVNLGTRSAQVSCPAAERTYYPWQPSQLDALKTMIAGKTESQAKAIIIQQGNGHLDPNSITFDISGGSYLPSKAATITLTVLVP